MSTPNETLSNEASDPTAWADVATHGIDKIAAAVEHAAAKAGPVADYGWELMVRGVVARSTADIILAAILAAIALFWAIWLNWYIRTAERYDGPNGDGECVISIIVGVIICGTIIGALTNAHDALPRLLAPESFAALELLQVIK